jgi:hypothetical protein
VYCPVSYAPFPWLEFAFREYGVRETRGRRTTPNIARYLASVGLSGYGDETAWCSAFVNWCMEQDGIPAHRGRNRRKNSSQFP